MSFGANVFGGAYYGQGPSGIVVIVAFSRGVIVATLVSGNAELLATSQNALLIVVDTNATLMAIDGNALLSAEDGNLWRDAVFSG